jgi:hypothetical protein
MTPTKKSAQQPLNSLPDDVGWDEIMYALYVRQKIEQGHQAAAEESTVPHDDVRTLLA